MHSDHQYIQAIRDNNQNSIGQLYRQYYPQAKRWIEQHGGNADDAQDVFQDTLIALFEKAKDSSFTLTCPIGALLHVIYSRKWIDNIRKKGRNTEVRIDDYKRYEEVYPPDTLEIAEQALEEQAKQTKIGLAFKLLSELCQQLLTLLSEGTPPVKAAEILQMNSVDTLYRRKNACIERWRTLYEAN
jgi:RNA polymerase sigma factor (sigma-70 family)